MKGILWFLGDDEELSNEGIIPDRLSFRRQFLPRALRKSRCLSLQKSATYWSELLFHNSNPFDPDSSSIPNILCGVPVISHLPAIKYIGTQRPVSSARSEHSTEIAFLQDDDVVQLLACVPGATGLCHWADGELQIVAPDVSQDQLARIQLPKIEGLNVSITQWSIDPTFGQRRSTSSRRGQRPGMVGAWEALRMGQPTSTHSTTIKPFSREVDSGFSYSKNIGGNEWLCSTDHPDMASIDVATPPEDITPDLPEYSLSQGTSVSGNVDLQTPQGHYSGISGVTQNPEEPNDPKLNGVLPQPLIRTNLRNPSPDMLEASHDIQQSISGEATSPPETPQYGPAISANTQQRDPIFLNPQSKVRIGSLRSTAGVKVRNKNTGDIFITVSTHAAFDGINEGPIKILKERRKEEGRKETVFTKLVKRLNHKRFRPWNRLDGQEVTDAETGALVRSFGIFYLMYVDSLLKIGTIEDTLDTLPTERQPVFPTDLTQNVSLVKPTSSQFVIPREFPLSWYHPPFTKGPVQLIPDDATGKAFAYGEFLYIEGREGKCSWSSKVHRNIVLFRRICDPFTKEEAQAMRGAPVATKEPGGDDRPTKVLGFMAFQFSPPPHAQEGRHDGVADLEDRLAQGKVTVCGAVVPRELKEQYDIVE